MADMLSRVETGRVFGDADADADGAEASPALHPLRFLGMGLLIAWLCCTHINTIYIDASSPARLPVETGMRLGDIGAFLAMAVLAPRIGALSGRRLAVSVSVLVTAFGTASIGLVLAPQESEVAILVAAAAATAIGGAMLFCLWAEVFCQMGPTSMVVYGGGSCIVAFLAYCLVSTMMQPFAIVATSLLPVLSLACAWASFKLLPREAPHASANYPVPWKIILIMGIGVSCPVRRALCWGVLPISGPSIGFGSHVWQAAFSCTWRCAALLRSISASWREFASYLRRPRSSSCRLLLRGLRPSCLS